MNSAPKRRGRKPVPQEEKMIQRVVTFNNDTYLKLYKMGEGNVSLGIRIATEVAYAQRQEALDLADLE